MSAQCLVARTLTSCTGTTDVEDVWFMYNRGLRVHLVDTPGFDDTNRSDVEVLQNIAHWLSLSFEHGVKLSGIIFLHRISDVRMAGSARRNLSMFKKLCGEICYPSILLATTMWSRVDEPTGASREAELVSKSEYWGFMVQRGSKVFRHTGTKESALDLVKYILSMDSTITLEIQDEIVNKQTIEQTGAAQELNAEIIRERKRHQAELENMRKDMKQAMDDRDEEMQRFYKEEQDKLNERIEKSAEEQKKLKDSLDEVHRRKEEELRAIQEKMEADRLREQERYEQDRKSQMALLSALEKRQTEEMERLTRSASEAADRDRKEQELRREWERERYDYQLKLQQIEADRKRSEARFQEQLRQKKESKSCGNVIHTLC